MLCQIKSCNKYINEQLDSCNVFLGGKKCL